MRRSIEISGEVAAKLSKLYFTLLLDKFHHDLEGDYTVSYKPLIGEKRAIVTINGDFDPKEAYSKISREFKITKINGVSLEEILPALSRNFTPISITETDLYEILGESGDGLEEVIEGETQ